MAGVGPEGEVGVCVLSGLFGGEEAGGKGSGVVLVEEVGGNLARGRTLEGVVLVCIPSQFLGVGF